MCQILHTYPRFMKIVQYLAWGLQTQLLDIEHCTPFYVDFITLEISVANPIIKHFTTNHIFGILYNN
jgi:hypothetical protein